MMMSQLNPLYQYLVGSPMLLRLACVVNSVKSSEISKIEWESFSILEIVKRMILLALGFVAWISHMFFKHFSVLDQSEKRSPLISESAECLDNAMQRALCQVFALVNDTPVSSEKYEFVRILIDKIIVENMAQNDSALLETNKLALESAFSRTLDKLAIALELQQQQEIKGESWSWTILRSIFSPALANVSQNVFSLESIALYLQNFLFPVNKPTRCSSESLTLMSASASQSSLNAVAEKLAQELLWIAEKLNEVSSINEAAWKFSTLSHLANLSLSAHPRVQASLLRMAVLLFNELATCETDASTNNLKTNLLLLWLPLFCHAKSGIDCPSFTHLEKARFLKSLEQNIHSLSVLDQERVLTCWLREYVSSPSEWPNLQPCFDNWCRYVRKSSQECL